MSRFPDEKYRNKTALFNILAILFFISNVEWILVAMPEIPDFVALVFHTLILYKLKEKKR